MIALLAKKKTGAVAARAPALDAPTISRVVAPTHPQPASAPAAVAGAAKPLPEDDTTPNSIHALLTALDGRGRPGSVATAWRRSPAVATHATEQTAARLSTSASSRASAGYDVVISGMGVADASEASELLLGPMGAGPPRPHRLSPRQTDSFARWAGRQADGMILSDPGRSVSRRPGRPPVGQASSRRRGVRDGEPQDRQA
eukprot:scaffold10192_cov59-Phaeocystis_antarctica.AAC.1